MFSSVCVFGRDITHPAEATIMPLLHLYLCLCNLTACTDSMLNLLQGGTQILIDVREAVPQTKNMMWDWQCWIRIHFQHCYQCRNKALSQPSSQFCAEFYENCFFVWKSMIVFKRDWTGMVRCLATCSDFKSNTSFFSAFPLILITFFPNSHARYYSLY